MKKKKLLNPEEFFNKFMEHAGFRKTTTKMHRSKCCTAGTFAEEVKQPNGHIIVYPRCNTCKKRCNYTIIYEHNWTAIK